MNYEETYDLMQKINDLTATKVDAFPTESAQQCALLLTSLIQALKVYVKEIALAHNKSVEISFSHTILNREEDYEYEMMGPFLKIGNKEVNSNNFNEFNKP